MIMSHSKVKNLSIFVLLFWSAGQAAFSYEMERSQEDWWTRHQEVVEHSLLPHYVQRFVTYAAIKVHDVLNNRDSIH